MKDLSSENRSQPWAEALGSRVLGRRQAWGSGGSRSSRPAKGLVGRERRAPCRRWGPEGLSPGKSPVLVLSVPCLRDPACLPAFLLVSSPPHLSPPSSLLSPSVSCRVSGEAALGTQLGLGSCGAFGGRCHPGADWVVGVWGCSRCLLLGRRPRHCFVPSSLVFRLLPVILCSLTER